MSQPRLEILGVYRPLIGTDTWQEQWTNTGNNEATQAHFERLVLIEAVVEGLTERFKMGKFGQMRPTGPVYPDGPEFPSHMQVGYDEGLLSSDGEVLIRRRMNCVQGTGRLRFAVFLHFYDPNRPLQWEFGEVNCPPIQEVPVRLTLLMPYRACT